MTPPTLGWRAVQAPVAEDRSEPGSPCAPDWMAQRARVPRGRVVRDGGESVLVVEMPCLEELEQPPTPRQDSRVEHEPAANEGAAAVAVAVAYRNGFDTGRRDGFASGHAEGLRLGRERALAEAAERNEAVLTQLREAASRHLAELESRSAQVSAQATELAFALAEVVVGRELALADDPGADAVRRALAAIGGRPEAIARLHPDDLARLRTDDLAPGTALTFVADEGIEPGGCLLESAATTVDASVGAAMSRARSVLGLEQDPT